MDNKYKLTDETIEFNGVKLYRIEALKDFSLVKKGDKGGFVQSERNLSHDGDCWIFVDSKVLEESSVSGNATYVYGNSVIMGYARILGDSLVKDSTINGFSKVWGQSLIENSRISGDSRICGNAEICDALIESSSDYIVFKNWWSSLRHFTWTRSNNMWKVGCFYGTGEELIEKAYRDSELSGREYKRVVEYVESILRDEIQNKEIINL